MQIHTQAIALRTTKYGESSLISSLFTRELGVESFMHKGIPKAKGNIPSLLQPGQVLDLVILKKSGSQWPQIREMSQGAIWVSIPAKMIKTSIALFTAEFLLRLLPQKAKMPELFDFSLEFFHLLEQAPVNELANLPLYFLHQSSNQLGFGIQGEFQAHTPFMDLAEGKFNSEPGNLPHQLQTQDLPYLSKLVSLENWTEVKEIHMVKECRHRLLAWYLDYIRFHTQHMGTIKSLDILRKVLH